MSTEPYNNIDTRELRNALGAFATGVTIVTTIDGSGGPVGMTANSFASVSLDPPLVLWSVSRGHDVFQAFYGSDYYAVHVLGQDQQEASNRFANADIDRFDGVEYDRGVGGLPLLKTYCARFQCRVEHRYDGGDHVILVGRVVEMDHRPSDPLIFHGSEYKQLADDS